MVNFTSLVENRVDEVLRGELTALIGVDIFRRAKPAIRFLKCVNRMNSVKLDPHTMRQNPAYLTELVLAWQRDANRRFAYC
jgi:hypothetical protein